MRFPIGVVLLDAVAVLVFATVGRASHAEGLSVGGVLIVAWPFLAGAAAGWVLSRVWRHQWPAAPGPGILVWAATLVVGMLLRALTGAGVAVSFVLVAALVLFAFMVGGRAVVEIVRFAVGGLGRWSERVAEEGRPAQRRR